MNESDSDLRERLYRVDLLLQEVEQWKDSQARARTKEIVQILMEFHGAGIERLLSRLPDGKLIDDLAEDELIASLLLLYGLHPLDLESRVMKALEKVRPYLHSHGGNVELLGTADGIIRLALQGSCHGCPSSALTLKQTVEEAIREKAPDAIAIEVEGEAPPAPAAPDIVHQGVSLPILAG